MIWEGTRLRSVVRSMPNNALLLVVTTIAGALSWPCDAQDFRALPPGESGSLQLRGSDTPTWPSRLFIEFEGQITIRAKFRFVYDAENAR